MPEDRIDAVAIRKAALPPGGYRSDRGAKPPQAPPSPPASLTPWIGIARAGTFQDSQGREHTFTEADLETIRAGYDPAISEAPLVFGHPKDNAPAYGWVSALKTEGEKLLAQFARVPAEVKNLVQDGRYRYVSMSLSPDKRRLLHVGLLGAAAPAIDGLGPVAFATGGLTINFTSEEVNMATVEELQRRVGELEAQLRAAQEENKGLKDKLAESDKDKDEAEKGQKTAEETAAKTAVEFAAFQAKIAADARAARVDALINAGKLEPAKKDETLSFTAALAQVGQPVNFSAPDGKTERISAEEKYFRDLEASPVDPRFSNFSTPTPAHIQTGEGARAVQADITKLL
ncbi:MAG: phage protease [Deltaproteobacteria bacterium]|jgi:hypothetical protein|nr:phage protease [Deltaproteobacteria bacterium]